MTVQAAAAQPLENGARVAGTGGAGAAMPGVLALRLNPASICCTASFFLMMGYSRAFGLSELDHYHAALGKQFGHGRLAVAMESFGFESYRQQTVHIVGAGLVERFGLAIGAAISAQRLSIPGVDLPQPVNTSVGVIKQLGQLLQIGASVRRVLQTGNAIEEGRLLVVGGTLRPTRQLVIVLDALKDGRFPLSIRAGMEVLPVRLLALRGGMSTAPETLSFGAGIHAGTARLDVAVHRHAALGWSRAVSLWIES